MSKKEIGQAVYDSNNKRIGIIAGEYDSMFYSLIASAGAKYSFKLWDKNYPGWTEKNVLVILYDRPQRNLSRKEVCQEFGLTEDQITDKLYEAVTYEYPYMVVPYDSAKTGKSGDEPDYDIK